jgi:hypothetical protein
VIIHTARISNPDPDPDRLDVTRKGDSVFSPSWPLLMAAKRGQITFAEYSECYTAEMRVSFVRHRAAWDEVLARERVVLCCYCQDPALCHRSLLAQLLAKAAERRGIEVELGGELAS